MSKEKTDQSAKKVARRKRITKLLKIILALLVIFLINLYIILGILYKKENFTVILESDFGRESNLTIYENLDKKIERTFLKSKDIDSFSDISIKWIPEDINNEAEGSHNGTNYIAYTFYAENQGQDTINYNCKIEIDDVVKNVDKAVRVMVYKNDEERVVYAHSNSTTGKPEEGTIAFKNDKLVMEQLNENFKVGDLDKYTVVIWIEGNDSDCTDNLIGGEIRMHMTLTEEHISENN